MLVAEREGFEPPEPLRAQRFSRPPRSTTLPSLHIYLGETRAEYNPKLYSGKEVKGV